MKMQALIAAPLVAVLVTALSAAPATLPKGWLRTGPAADCRSGAEAVAGAPTAKVFVIACPEPAKAGDFATLMQSVAGRDYAGRRVRLSAQVQGSGLRDWGGLWLRADSRERVRVFENMQQRPLAGDFAWREAAIVLDLPANVDSLHFGFLLDGQGTLRATDFRLEVVGDEVATTSDGQQGQPGQPIRPGLPVAPRNLTPS